MAGTITVAVLQTLLQTKDDTFSSGLQGATRQAGTWAANIGKTVATAGLAVVAAGAAAAAAGVLGLGAAIVKMTIDAAAVQGTVNTFDKLVMSVGGESVRAMNLLREATRGMVADSDLMAASNKFLAMGIVETTEGAAELALVSTQLGMAMGEDATASMENFALMMANQSIPRLDSFGISSSKVRERIKELMDETAGLSREAAFNAAVMEQAALTMEKVGEQSDTAAGSMANIKTAFENAKLGIGQAFQPALESILIPIKGLTSTIGPQLIEWAQLGGAWLGEKLPEAIGVMQETYNGLIGFFRIVLEEGDTLNDWLTHLPEPMVPIVKSIGDIVVGLQDFIKYITFVVDEGDTLNDWLSHLPEQVQPAVKAIGEIVVSLQGDLPLAIQAVTDFWNDELIPAFEEAEKFIKDNLTPIIGGLKGAFVGLAVALAGGAIAALISGIGSAIAAVATPVMALIALGALIGAAWAGNWGGIRDIVDNAINNVILPAVEAIKIWFETNWPIIQRVALTAWKVIQDIMQTVADVFVSEILPKFREAFDSISEALAALGVDWSTLGTVVKTVLAVMAALLLAAVGIIVGLINAVAAAVANMADVWHSQVENVMAIVDGFKLWWEGVSNVVMGILTLDFPRALEGFGQAFTGMFETVKAVVNSIWDVIRLTFGTVLAFIGGFVDGVVGFFQGLWDRLTGGSIIPEMMADIENVITTALDFVSDLWETFKDNVVGFVETLKTDIDRVWGNIKTAMETAWTNIKTSAETKASDVWEAITTVIAAIKTSMDTTWANIKVALETVWGTIKGVAEIVVQAIWTAITTKIDEIKTSMDTTWANIKQAVITVWDEVRLEVELAVTEVITEVVGLFETMLETVRGFIADFVQAGQDLIGGLIEGILLKAIELYRRIRDVIQGAFDAVTDEMDSGSYSRVTFAMGVDFVQGLIEGVLSQAGEWFDVVGGLLDIGRTISGLGGIASRLFRQQQIDPFTELLTKQKDRLKVQEDVIARLREEGASQAEITEALRQRRGILGDIAHTTNDINDAEFALAKFAKQKDRLAFLKQQSDLVKLIRDNGLDAQALLGGLQLGAEADPAAVLTAMTAAMSEIVARSSQELQNVVNPILPVLPLPPGIPGNIPYDPVRWNIPYEPATWDQVRNQFILFVNTVSSREDLMQDFALLQAMA